MFVRDAQGDTGDLCVVLSGDTFHISQTCSFPASILLRSRSLKKQLNFVENAECLPCLSVEVCHVFFLPLYLTGNSTVNTDSR